MQKGLSLQLLADDDYQLSRKEIDKIWLQLGSSLEAVDTMLIKFLNKGVEITYPLDPESTLFEYRHNINLVSKEDLAPEIQNAILECLYEVGSLLLQQTEEIDSKEDFNILVRQINEIVGEAQKHVNNQCFASFNIDKGKLAKLICRLTAMKVLNANKFNVRNKIENKTYFKSLNKIDIEKIVDVYITDNTVRTGIFVIDKALFNDDGVWGLRVSGDAVTGEILDKNWLNDFFGRKEGSSLLPGDAFYAKYTYVENTLTNKKHYYLREIIYKRAAAIMEQQSMEFNAG
jgi:hypothetical protein